MNKKQFIALFFTLAFVNLTIVYLFTNTHINNRLEAWAQHNQRQASKTKQNHEFMKDITLKLASIQNKINMQATEITKIDKLYNKPKTIRATEQQNIELRHLKQQLDDLAKNTTNSLNKLSNAILLNASSEKNTPYKPPQTMEEMRKIAKDNAIQTEQKFEAYFDESVEDNQLTIGIEEKLERLVNNNALGNEVQVKKVNCHSDLCKVVISHPEDSFNLMKYAENVPGDFTSISKDSGISGVQETIIYQAPIGKKMPKIKIE